MQVRERIHRDRLGQIPAGLVAFDLEMANSFTQAPAVICMIGTEQYFPQLEECRARIAFITERDEEPLLVSWFLEELRGVAAEHERPRLLSFSGIENDMPWLRQRFDRFNLAREEREVLERFGHVDLKVEFYRRTHSDHMSLKNLERVFGIDRDGALQSRKVSFILTDIVRGQRADGQIPERVFEYLHQDVHNLMLIYDRWADVSLEEYRLGDVEYLAFLNALRNALRKLIQSPLRRRRDTERSIKALEGFQAAFEAAVDRALLEGTFVEFTLPELPELDSDHPEVHRIARKHQRLQSIHIKDEKTGAYLLRSRLNKPKGALAVVRHGGRLLMIRRADKLKRAGGYWGLPGGTLNEGESPEAGAVRELREELNLSGRAGKVLGTSTSLSGEYHLYWVEVEVEDTSPLAPDEKEVAEARWVTPGDVRGLDPLIPGALEGFRRFLGREWEQ
jgi:NAD+ diphosphatase